MRPSTRSTFPFKESPQPPPLPHLPSPTPPLPHPSPPSPPSPPTVPATTQPPSSVLATPLPHQGLDLHYSCLSSPFFLLPCFHGVHSIFVHFSLLLWVVCASFFLPVPLPNLSGLLVFLLFCPSWVYKAEDVLPLLAISVPATVPGPQGTDGSPLGHVCLSPDTTCPSSAFPSCFLSCSVRIRLLDVHYNLGDNVFKDRPGSPALYFLLTT